MPGFGPKNPVNPWAKTSTIALLDPSSHPWGPVMASRVRKSYRRKRSRSCKISKLQIIQADNVVDLSRFSPTSGRAYDGIQNVLPSWNSNFWADESTVYKNTVSWSRFERIAGTSLFVIELVRIRKCKKTPHKRFSKMMSLNAKNLESVLLAEPHVAVIFPCQTLPRSTKVSCRTLQIAEPNALNSENDYLAEPWNAGSFRKCRQNWDYSILT